MKKLIFAGLCLSLSTLASAGVKESLVGKLMWIYDFRPRL